MKLISKKNEDLEERNKELEKAVQILTEKLQELNGTSNEKLSVENCATYAISDPELDRHKVTEAIDFLRASNVRMEFEKIKAENQALRERCKYYKSQIVLPEV